MHNKMNLKSKLLMQGLSLTLLLLLLTIPIVLFQNRRTVQPAKIPQHSPKTQSVQKTADNSAVFAANEKSYVSRK